MDPNENLREQKELAEYLVNRADATKAERLAELVLALDEWVANGGFLPERWYLARLR